MALVLGGGGSAGSSLALAHDLLQRHGSLQNLARCSPAELAGAEGIGSARSAAIVAAFELGRRAQRRQGLPLRSVESPEDAASLFAPLLEGLDREAVAVMCLGGRHQPLHVGTVAIGSLNAASVHPREVFRMAVAAGAAAVVLAHNHPSGDCEPSDEDVRLTRRLMRCGETLGIEVLDHIVIGDGEWVSLRQQQLLQ